ncbi:MAG TPA: hypothetical protein VGQ59_16340 [Cyclobacteriaceae bacterium]|jgi:hypothetical protein|nr:hypothetical protein [Cyclobacteriaceae bacterium]
MENLKELKPLPKLLLDEATWSADYGKPVRAKWLIELTNGTVKFVVLKLTRKREKDRVIYIPLSKFIRTSRDFWKAVYDGIGVKFEAAYWSEPLENHASRILKSQSQPLFIFFDFCQSASEEMLSMMEGLSCRLHSKAVLIFRPNVYPRTSSRIGRPPTDDEINERHLLARQLLKNNHRPDSRKYGSKI